MTKAFYLLLPIAGCTFSGPRLVSITPVYGYVDGCTPIVLQGANLDTTGSATIGGADVLELAAAEEDPNFPDHAQDVGFKYFGKTPPAPDGEPQFADISMTIDGEVTEVADAYYYIACPAPLNVESIGGGSTDEGAAPNTFSVGDTFALAGCGLPADLTVGFFDNAEASQGTTTVSSDCGTAEVSGSIPTLAAGQYLVQLSDSSGNTFGSVCAGLIDGTSTDTGAECANPIIFTIQ